MLVFFFFQAEDGIRAGHVTGVQTCALPISAELPPPEPPGMRSRSQGLRVGPKALLSVEEPIANSSMLVLPRMGKIGRASCREREEIAAVAGAVQRKRNDERRIGAHETHTRG